MSQFGHDVDDEILEIESDLAVEGSLLMSMTYGVVTTDGECITTLAGNSTRGFLDGPALSSKFNSIHDFVQLSQSEVILVDANNYCLRKLNRNEGQVTTYAGKCGFLGGDDGSPLLATFMIPISIVRPEADADYLIVADNYRSTIIRKVNITTRYVSTLYDTQAMIFSLNVDPNHENAFIAVGMHSMIRLHDNNQQDLITGNSRGSHPYGPLANASYAMLKSVIHFAESTYFVADVDNNQLSVVNEEMNMAHALCTGAHNYTFSSTYDCAVLEPSALLLNRGILYVGSKRKLLMFPGRLLVL